MDNTEKLNLKIRFIGAIFQQKFNEKYPNESLNFEAITSFYYCMIRFYALRTKMTDAERSKERRLRVKLKQSPTSKAYGNQLYQWGDIFLLAIWILASNTPLIKGDHETRFRCIIELLRSAFLCNGYKFSTTHPKFLNLEGEDKPAEKIGDIVMNLKKLGMEKFCLTNGSVGLCEWVTPEGLSQKIWCATQFNILPEYLIYMSGGSLNPRSPTIEFQSQIVETNKRLFDVSLEMENPYFIIYNLHSGEISVGSEVKAIAKPKREGRPRKIICYANLIKFQFGGILWAPPLSLVPKILSDQTQLNSKLSAKFQSFEK